MIGLTADSEQLAAQALLHLQNVLKTAELEAEAEIERIEGENTTLAVSGSDAPLLVGPHGQALDALQYLLSLMTNKSREHRLRITVDAAGYRARRTQTLVKFAQDLAAQVAKSGQEAITDPLNAMDRRIIHTALVDNAEIETYSEGDEPNRYVVVSPRQTESKA